MTDLEIAQESLAEARRLVLSRFLEPGEASYDVDDVLKQLDNAAEAVRREAAK